MNRTKGVLINTLATGGYQLAAMLMGFITPRLMIQFYGSEINGLVVSINEFINYFKLVEAGLATAAVYSLYKPLSDHDEGAISAIVSAARRFYQLSGYCFAALTLAFACVYPFVVPVSDMSGLSVGLLAAVMGISGTLEFFTLARYRVLLTADRKTYVVSLASLASLMLTTAVIVVMAVFQVNVIVMRLCAGLCILLRSLLLSSYVRRHYPYVNYHAAPNKSALAKRWDALYKQITTSVQQSLGVVLCTVITRDSVTVSVFGTYHMVIIGLWGILKMVTTGIYAFFGELLVKGEQKRFQRAYQDFECFFMGVVTVIYATAAVMILPFVQNYIRGVADANYIQPSWGILLVVMGMVDQLAAPMDLMVTAAGMFRETRHHNTIQVGLAVTLGLTLGLVMGVPGILIGITLANLTRMGIQLWFVPSHITLLPFRQTLKRIVRAFVTAALTAGPVLIWFPVQADGFVQWLLYALITAVCAGLIAAASAWLFDRRAFMSLVERAKGLLHGRAKM